MNLNIIECMRLTYEQMGMAVLNIASLPDGTFEMEYIGGSGITKSQVGVFFCIQNDQQCQQKKSVPNE